MKDVSSLLGGQLGSNLQGLIDQFQQGQHQAVPDEQVSSAYGQVAAGLPQDQYEQAARDAFSRLSPQQRQEFLQTLQTQTQQSGTTGAAAGAVQSASADPGSLAQATAQVHAEQPNLLQQMFAPGGTFSSPIAKAALLGISAMAAQRLMGGHR
ncbi:MAG TPA: hypothetical protein VFP22_01795 [Candidatus Limnocylindrales bacterium]|nr:hypothetical protein [Candidatus Limnocylindrales bacterium]